MISRVGVTWTRRGEREGGCSRAGLWRCGAEGDAQLGLLATIADLCCNAGSFMTITRYENEQTLSFRACSCRPEGAADGGDA